MAYSVAQRTREIGVWMAIAASVIAIGLAAALVLLLAGIAAAWLPARRATRVDPITALREDG